MFKNKEKGIERPPTVLVHTYDLPQEVVRRAPNTSFVAIDTEAMGLRYHRDRLCTVQISFGEGTVHLVHFPEPIFNRSTWLVKLLSDDRSLKIAHYARFDIGIIRYTFGVLIRNVYCTKIASRLCRTYTDRHGLKDVCKDLLHIELNKEVRTSDWGVQKLSKEQIQYASQDVLYLHAIKDILDNLTQREGRTELLSAYNRFLPYRAELDLLAGDRYEPMNYHMYSE